MEDHGSADAREVSKLLEIEATLRARVAELELQLRSLEEEVLRLRKEARKGTFDRTASVRVC